MVACQLDESVATSACDALNSIAREPAGCESIVAAGGVAAIVTALTGHPKVRGLAASACSALCYVVSCGDDAGIASVLAAGGAAAIVATMDSFFYAEEVVLKGSGALGGLAKTVAGSTAVVAAGGAKSVVTALAALKGNVLVVTAACRALGVIAGSIEGSERAFAAGAVRHLLAAREAHFEAAEDANAALAALRAHGFDTAA